MSTKNEKRDLQTVNITLLNGQVDLILKAMELYAYNLDYMLTDDHSDSEERKRKIAMLKYTYEIVLSNQAEQVNGKVHNAETLNKFGRNMLNDQKVIDFIKNEEENNDSDDDQAEILEGLKAI